MKKTTLVLIALGMTLHTANAQTPAEYTAKQYDQQLEDVMELIDTTQVKEKLTEVETAFQQRKTELTTVRLGLIYHETALNLSFLTKSRYRGYAQKSYDLLTGLFESDQTAPALRPIVASYRASALALVGAETKKTSLLSDAFRAFGVAIDAYSDTSPYPEFLRGSVAENLPWFFFRKRKAARLDFERIIRRQAQNPAYANWKVMSFTYWAWAAQHQSGKDRVQAMDYLEKAVQLDPTYLAGRKRAEELKRKLLTK